MNITKPTLFKVPVGDWSKDGHNVSENYYVYSNYPLEKMQQAYKDTCKKIGLQMNDSSTNYTGLEDGMGTRRGWRCLLTDYEESTISDEAIQILSEHGFDFRSVFKDESDGTIYFTSKDVFTLFMWFISYSMPKDFEWKELNLDAEAIIGYWSESLNHQIGYGVFC
ncbi:hypothetical protein [Bacillus cereus]|uniref:hypothetical protein n=1 Tax=Bacillus cereus TaxID=1396 RepID=UPI000BF3FBA8|nr:hypothetical protein [Bacillus cereus]PFA76864.1 hypothetical protein CN406_17570 [Bacillus cereus]